MPKYSKIEKDGAEYYRTSFSLGGKRYDLLAKTIPELDEKVRRAKNDYESGINSGDVSFRIWALEWLETYKKPYISKKNYGTYQGIVNKHLLPVLGVKKLKDIKQVALQRIISSNTDKSKTYLARIKITLNSIFKQAVINGYIPRNPTEGIVLPKKKEESHRTITDAEKELLFKACESNRHGMYALMIYYCGLRPQEVGALQWCDIDIKNKTVTVSKAVESGVDNVKEPKSDAGYRTVPIPTDFAKMLEEKSAGKKPDDYYVTKDNGKRGDSSAFHAWWKSIKRDMNIQAGAAVKRNHVEEVLADDLTAYCLRHTYCTNLQRMGIPLNIAKYYMGHSDIRMTADIYTHYTDDQTQTSKELMDKYYGENGEKKSGENE